MKKLQLLALILALTLLAGCALVRNEYVRVEPHSEASSQEPRENEATVKDYTGLKNALLGFVEQGVEEAVISTSSYSGSVEQDYQTAAAYVMHTNPLGAYAVEDMTETISHVTSYYQIVVQITYRHTPQEIDEIVTVRGMDGAREAIGAALERFVPSVAVRISSFEDTDFRQVVQDYCRSHLTTAIECPAVAVALYPDSGNVRIAELTFSYAHTQEELKSRLSAVTTILNASYGYVRYGQSEEEQAALLYSFLMERFDYTEGESETPAYALLCEGTANGEAFAGVFAAMCEKAGLQCLQVHGQRAGEDAAWNILQLESGNYHVDLLSAARSGQRELTLLTDSQMEGYDWDRTAYPACPGSNDAPQPDA